MGEDHGNEATNRSTELAEQRTDLAVTRTVIAAERTLMAWIRTSISMIGFGFTIYKFFQYLGGSEGAPAHIRRPQAPRNLGLTLVSLGTLALIAAVFQHRQMLKSFGFSEAKVWRSLSLIIAILMVLVGVLAFIGILARTGPF